jgi:hypothetical protein
MPLAQLFQNSHQDGGPLFLIFFADPTTVRLSSRDRSLQMFAEERQNAPPRILGFMCRVRHSGDVFESPSTVSSFRVIHEAMPNIGILLNLSRYIALGEERFKFGSRAFEQSVPADLAVRADPQRRPTCH